MKGLGEDILYEFIEASHKGRRRRLYAWPLYRPWAYKPPSAIAAAGSVVCEDCGAPVEWREGCKRPRVCLGTVCRRKAA